MSNMKKIVLTGASGFVGSYFVKNFSDKFKIKTFSFRRDDFATLDMNGIDTVVHLSAIVHQMKETGYDVYEDVNVFQSISLAKKAKSSGVKQFVYMSTVKVYGEETDKPYSENSLCHPRDNYGKSKLEAEKKLLELQDESFIISIIRTPIVYGHGVKANIKNLINLINKTPVLPFGNIKNRRSMIYIGNLCFYLDNIIEKQMGGIFLVSDDKPLSTTELCRLIANSLNKKIYLVKVPFFASLLKILKPSIHKRLFESLEVDNRQTIKKLFNDENILLPYRVDEGIEYMIKGEPK